MFSWIVDVYVLHEIDKRMNAVVEVNVPVGSAGACEARDQPLGVDR
jgi:hypothetical protein